jgi:hypothetical protein
MTDRPETLSLARLTREPAWYPETLDLAAREVHFCRMDAASYRASPFLDGRIVRAGEARGVLPFAELAACETLPVPAGVHYIFHSAFCCSTLLTRQLDAINRFRVLREPDILYQVATCLRFRGTPLLLSLAADEWHELYGLVTFLLGRREGDATPVIIKPSDGCNNLMTTLLAQHPDNRGLFLTSSLPRFLAAVLKLPARHEWARIRARELSLDAQRAHGRVEVNPQGLDAGQTAALVWVLQHDICRAVCAANGTALATLDERALLDRPAATLDALLRHFGVPLAPDAIERALACSDSAVHSKAPELHYDPQARERDFNAARVQLEPEIESALRWAEERFGAERVGGALPNPLL